MKGSSKLIPDSSIPQYVSNARSSNPAIQRGRRIIPAQTEQISLSTQNNNPRLQYAVRDRSPNIFSRTNNNNTSGLTEFYLPESGYERTNTDSHLMNGSCVDNSQPNQSQQSYTKNLSNSSIGELVMRDRELGYVTNLSYSNQSQGSHTAHIKNSSSNSKLIEAAMKGQKPASLTTSSLKIPLRYAGEVGTMLQVFQGYETLCKEIVQASVKKPEYNGQNIDSNECFQRYYAISSYYSRGTDMLGKKYDQKESYKAYLEVLGEMVKSPTIKELGRASSEPTKFAQEYNLNSEDVKILGIFNKKFRAAVKKVINDIVTQEPSLKKMAGDMIKDQVLGTFTDQLKDSLGINCVQKVLSSTVGKVAALIVTAGVAAVGGGFVGKYINNQTESSDSKSTSADPQLSVLQAENTALKAEVQAAKVASEAVGDSYATLLAMFKIAMTNANPIYSPCLLDSMTIPGRIETFATAYNASVASMPSDTSSVQWSTFITTQMHDIIPSLIVCSA